MRILAVDVGTGTQDILLFDSFGPIENSVKLVMPSATTIAAGRIRRATPAGRPVLLTGVIQGGGPPEGLRARVKQVVGVPLVEQVDARQHQNQHQRQRKSHENAPSECLS